MGDKNNYFVKAAAKDVVGIYSTDFFLYGWIPKARLDDPSPITQDEVITLSESKHLFTDDLPTGRQYELLSGLQQLHHVHMRERVENDFGFRYEDLTLNEQLWFLEFLQDKKKSEVAPVAKFIKTFGTDGLRAFAALEHDGAAAEAIFAIAEKLPETRARAVFKKYVELAESAGTLDAQAQTFFATPAIGQENVERRATAELMKRAARLLKDFAAWAKDKNVQGLQDALDAINQDVLIFASIFKTAFDERKGKLDFAEVRGLDFEERPAEFTPAEIAQMEEIIRKNYAGTPLVEGVLKGLRSAFGKDNNRFYVLKKGDQIISFNRFETKPPLAPPYEGGETRSVVEFASFNTDPAYQKSAIGRVMMEKTLDAKAQDNVVVAETDPMSPVASHYVEQAGFVIVGAQEYKGTGVFVFEIERDDHKQYARTGEIVALGKGADVAHRVQELTSQGKVLTRYFKEGGVFNAVIEEKQD